MESQCPACKKFSTTYLKQLLATQEMRDIVDFKFVPWGNAIIQDARSKEVLNTTALLSRTLHQYTELASKIEQNNNENPVQKLLGKLENGITSAWASLHKEISALHQMDAINPKYMHAHEASDMAPKTQLFETHTTSLTEKINKFIAKEKALEHAAATRQEKHAAKTLSGTVKPLQQLKKRLDASEKTGKAKAGAKISQRASLERNLATLSHQAQQLQQLETPRTYAKDLQTFKAAMPRVQALQASSNASNASAGHVDPFEAWLASQPKFDMQTWLESQSTKNASDPRSDLQIWLDEQPQFDMEAWIAAQPSFDINAYLNPPAGNGSNASLAAQPQHRLSLYQNTIKAVDHLKKMLHQLSALRSSPAFQHQQRTISLAAQATPMLAFACQHGGTECAGNAWESCVQDVYPDESAFFPVIDCIELKACAEGQTPPAPGTFPQPGDCEGYPADVAPTCVKTHGKGMNLQALSQCVFGNPAQKGLQVPRSTILLIQNALATTELGTSRQWVPWLTINDEPVSHNDDEFNQMFLVGTKVCDIYKTKTGKEPPAQCASFIKVAPEKDAYAAFENATAEA